jgi:hypothetical protein
MIIFSIYLAAEGNFLKNGILKTKWNRTAVAIMNKKRDKKLIALKENGNITSIQIFKPILHG